MGGKYKLNQRSQKLFKLLDGVDHWTILESKIAKIEDTKEKGDIFEEFCKLFFRLTSKYDEFKFNNIWSFKDVPDHIRKRLSIVQPKDYGIDIIIECENGDLWTVQSKFRTNREPISHRQISTFYRSSKYAKFKLIVSNSHSIATPLETEQKDEGSVLGNDLDLIEESFYDMLRDFLKNLRVNRLDFLKDPFDYQNKIIEKSITHFENKNNGQLIMACGSGKTYVSFWVKEKLKPLNTIVFVPSLALMKQTFNEWTNQRKDDFYYSCICSDPTVASDADEPHIAMSEFGVPVTTNETELLTFLKDESKTPKVVFSTYQSTDVILKAIRQLENFKFDFGIFDEAHKTSGKEKRRFTACLDVPINKRLFMTATPKIYLEYLRKKAKEEDIELFSMDDISVYGNVISELKFSDAIKEGILVDYKIKIIFITNEEVKRLIQRCQELQIEDKYGYYKDVSADRFAKQIAIIKSMNEANRVISFHTTINGAKKFALEQNTISIPNTLKIMGEAGMNVPNVKTFHITGKFPTSKRSDILKEFGECSKAILSNARCLTEGVDLPAIDGIYFVDPKQSTIDIVQATGRAIRRDKKNPNKVGYIIISIFVSENEDQHQILQTGAFKQVWKIVNAMKSQDVRIMEIIDKLKMDRVKEYYDDKALDKKEHAKLVKDFNRFIEVENIPANFNKEEFIKSIRLKTIDTLGSAWFEWYQRLIDYNQKNKKWPHAHTKGKEGRLGTWASNQRRRYKEGILEKEKEELLNKINFPFIIWGTLDGLWMRNYKKLKKYKEEKGRWPPNLRKEGSKYYTKEEIDLGGWLQHQRYWHKKGKLSQERMNFLNQIEGDWFNDSTAYQRDKLWWSMCKEFIEFRKNHPNRFPLARNKDERKLHRWIYTQKKFYQKGNLPEDRLKKLQEIGFPLETQRSTSFSWFSRFNELKKYKEETGKWPPTVGRFSDRYSEYEIRLGNWLKTQRASHKSEKLSPEKIKFLKSIDEGWLNGSTSNLLDEKWDKKYSELVEFRKDNPDSWPIKNDQDNGLYGWCYWQKRMFQRGILKEGRYNKLKEIHFHFVGKVIMSKRKVVRERGIDMWLKKYNALKEYKEGKNHWPPAVGRFGGKYTNHEVSLGNWIRTQRQLYNLNKLSHEKIQKLREIDFPFQPSMIIQKVDKTEENIEKLVLSWVDWYELLKRFRQQNPNKWPIRKGQELKLARWCSQQRTKRINGQLENKQIDKLNEINFDWNPRKNNFTIWIKKYGEVIEYKKKYLKSNQWPHTRMKDKKAIELGKWVSGQRQRYRQGKLEKEKLDLLKKVNFVFRPQEDIDVQWMKLYEGVKKFKEMNGRFPRRLYPPKDEYTKFENKFGDWCAKERRYFKQGKLSQDKIDLLNKINFDWKEGKVSNYQDDIWEKKYQQLLNFRIKYDRWPQPYNEGEKELHNFWKGQKRAYMLGQITPERIEKLKEIPGFEFKRRNYKREK